MGYAVEQGKVFGSMHCFDDLIDGVTLCPLSVAFPREGGEGCTNAVGGDEECSSNTPNARVQWSEYNTLNRDEVTAEALFKNPLTGLTVDIIATRDVSKE